MSNKKIWKWNIDVVDRQELMIPAGAKILTVQPQSGGYSLWALCNEKMPKQPRQIAIYGTGIPMPSDPGEYIATFQMYGGNLVFHAFEIRA